MSPEFEHFVESFLTAIVIGWGIGSIIGIMLFIWFWKKIAS